MPYNSQLFVLRIVTWYYNCLQGLLLVTWKYITVNKWLLLNRNNNLKSWLLDWNTWNHTTVCKLLVLDSNTWFYGVSALFRSFNAELSHFGKSFKQFKLI